jgi:hypothetical protein
MRKGTLKLGNREIVLVAGNERIRDIASHLRTPFTVQQIVNAGAYSTQVVFGNAWSWDERPTELKAQFDAELEQYLASIPDEVNIRTSLPDISWTRKYIPTEEELTATREARKTPEQREQEARQQAERIAQAQAAAAAREAQAKAQEEACAALKAQFPFLELEKGSSKSSHALAAHNIRLILSRAFPGHTFSVRSDSYSMGSSIYISWTDGPTVQEVETHTDLFQKCDFDGSQDLETHRAGPHPFGSVSYVNHTRAISNETSELLKNEVGSDSHAIHRAFTERSFFVPSDVPPMSQDVPSSGNVRRNVEHNGIEVKFPDKPSPDVIDWLKGHGFRWSKFQKLWYARFSDSLFSEAQARFA